MDQATLLWLFGTLITLLTIVIGAIAAALWAHIGHCKDVSAAVSRIDTNLGRVMSDIGDHHTGIRSDIREHTSRLFKLDARVESLERREDER